MTEEDKLVKTIDTALELHTGKLKHMMGQVRSHLKAGEYHLAVTAMTELTTTQANVSMELRSILVKRGMIESEL
jgi:hypothetical protein